jgi:hypothetical protein
MYQFQYWLLLAMVLISPHLSEPFAKLATLFCVLVGVVCALVKIAKKS